MMWVWIVIGIVLFLNFIVALSMCRISALADETALKQYKAIEEKKRNEEAAANEE